MEKKMSKKAHKSPKNYFSLEPQISDTTKQLLMSILRNNGKANKENTDTNLSPITGIHLPYKQENPIESQKGNKKLKKTQPLHTPKSKEPGVTNNTTPQPMKSFEKKKSNLDSKQSISSPSHSVSHPIYADYEVQEFTPRKNFAYPIWMRSPNPEVIPIPVTLSIISGYHTNAILTSEYKSVRVMAA